jgi:hypothetical protein
MNLLNLEDEKFKNVTVKGFKFRIRWMTPLDKIKVTQQRVFLQNGSDLNSFTQEEFIFFENIGMVNICTEEMPKDFKPNESCINWNDIELINGLASEIRTHTTDIESKLKKNKPALGSE